jgi:hypothetical protein
MTTTDDHRPYFAPSARSKDKKVAECRDLIAAVAETGEDALAVFQSSAVSYRYLLITTTRVLGLDPTHKRTPAKAVKQVVSRDSIVGSAPITKGSTARVRLELSDGSTEEYGGLAPTEVDEIVGWLTAEDHREHAAATVAREHSQQADEHEWRVAFDRVPVLGSPINKPTRREIEANCRSGEVPRFIIGSFMAGALAAFDDRCLLVKKGVMTSWGAGSLGGGRVTTFLYSQITGIEYNAGLTSGVLEILTPSYSGTTNKDFWRGTGRSPNSNSDSPFALSNTLPLSKSEYKQARAQVEELKRLVGEAHQIQVKVEVPAPLSRATDSLAGELERLADLRERGLLDEDEFKAAKNALLSSRQDA